MPSAPPGPATDPVLLGVRGFRLPSGGRFDLEVRQGEVVLLRGANGCGKTTLLRHLAGLSGAPVAASRPVHYATQDPRDTLVGLTVAGEFRLRGADSLPPALRPIADADVATLSSGQVRRLSLAVAAAATVPILLLDEPAEGLDEEGRRWLRALVADARTGGCVVATDHTGTLAATRAVFLGGEAEPAFGPLVHGRGPPVLEASARRIPRDHAAVDLPSVSLGPGFHVLQGPNGGGKSTLLLRLAGLLEANGVRIRGQAPDPGRNVRLLLPRAIDLFRRPRSALELEGLGDAIANRLPDRLLERHPLTLSGGEAQRLALLKTFGRPADVYLLDEPEAHLDADGWRLLHDLVRERAEEGACVLAATHDRRLVGQAQTVITVGGG